MASLFPPIEALTSSQALSALATKKRAAFDHSDDNNMSDAKRQRYEDPLDLSSAHLGRVVDAQDEVDVDVLSVDPPTMTSRNDPERWSVDQVALFVANIESCQEYAEVRFLIHFASDVSNNLSHSIKCATVLQMSNEKISQKSSSDHPTVVNNEAKVITGSKRLPPRSSSSTKSKVSF